MQDLPQLTLQTFIGNFYTTPGDKILICDVISDDGNCSVRLDFTIPGFSFVDYNIMVSDESYRLVSFMVENDFVSTPVNFSTGLSPLSFVLNHTLMPFGRLVIFNF